MTPGLRLVSTDFDGTIAEADGRPILAAFFERLRQWREKGPVAWIINTGRTWESVNEELMERGAPFWPEWVVAVEREIWRVQDRKAAPWGVWNEKCHETHRQLFHDIAPFWKLVDDYIVRHTNAQMVRDSGSPFGIIASTEDEADEISAYLAPLLERQRPLVVVRNSVYFRFSHEAYNKGVCLQAIAEHLDISPAGIFVSGDHFNDLPMLDRRHAHHITCPANSVDEVKKKVRAQGGYLAKGHIAEGTLEGLDHFFPPGV